MSMTISLIAFGAAFFLAVAITPLVRRQALRWGVVDRPDNFRKVHTREIPRLGGVATWLAFLVPVVVCYLAPLRGMAPGICVGRLQIAALLLGGLVALGLGVADDVLHLRARWKLVFQCMAAVAAFSGGFQVTRLSNPFGSPVELGLFAFPATLVWFLLCMNAINLLDGLDGLAAGASLFACITLFMVSSMYRQPAPMFLMACLSGSILGFLMYNFHPASIFLGDSGTMFLGYSIAAISLMQTRKTEAALTLLVPLVALGVPLFDTGLAVLRRWSRRLPISAADRQHIHHVLISLGLSHKKAVLILYGACVALCGTAYLIAVGRNELTLFLLGALGIVGFASARMFGGMRMHDVFDRFSEDLNRLGRSASAKLAVERSIARMAAADSLDALWQECAEAFGGLQIDAVRLNMVPSGRVFGWPARPPTGPSVVPPPNAWTARFSMELDRETTADLEVVKIVNGETLMPDVPHLVERLRGELARNLRRILGLPAETGAPVAVLPRSASPPSVGVGRVSGTTA
jgi:UDP-GlcNAc:undecaprenyl-phosphate GlcNAc-1-phosphate transferase